jgi:hemerythrin-like domain-containing protein
MKTQGRGFVADERGANHPRRKNQLYDIQLYGVLHEDHEKIRDLFLRIEKSDSSQVDTRQELFTKLEGELQIHMEAEERFFYTALEQHDGARPRVLESYEEHQVAKSVIGAFTSLAVDDERWPAKLKVLRQLFLQHIDAEEHELFHLGQELLSSQQLQVIVTRVQEFKREPRKNAGKLEAS